MALTPIPDRIDDYARVGQTYPGLAELKVNQLRALRTKLKNQREEGIALAAYYRAWGPANVSGTSRTPKAVTFVTGSKVYPLHSTNAFDDAIAVSTPKFLDNFFPNGGEKPALDVQFYTQTLVSGSYVPVYNRTVSFTKKYMDKNLTKKSGKYWPEGLKGKDRLARVTFIDIVNKELSTGISETEKQITKLGFEIEATPTVAPNTPDPNAFIYDYGSKALKYNVGMVKEAYFSAGKDFQNLANLMKGGNTPTSVTTAEELWKDASSNKGMIWLYADGGKKDNFTVISETQRPNDSTFKRWAFQFHYNPGTLDMAWAGSPDVDTAMESSGLERFNLLGEQTMSTITFDLVLNRIFDFQYYGTDGKLKAGRRGDRNPYAPVQPSEEDQSRIYNYGTMYDVEFLLSTILGYKLDTRFRGTTSDIGFLTGRPVDLHLGHKLRYWGYIGAISVSHRIFDERMVPIFSTVSITFNRIPDYQV
jgi:hypothetical protein